MDYNKKYIKYKIKYIELCKKIDGNILLGGKKYNYCKLPKNAKLYFKR